MQVKIEITLEDVKEFLRNSNQAIRDNIVKDLEDLPLPREFRTEMQRVTIPACTNRDGTIRKGSRPRQEWQPVTIKNDDIETIIEKEINPTWKDIEGEIEDNIVEWSCKVESLYDTYKDNNTFIVKGKSLNEVMQLEELLKGFDSV